MSKIIKPNCQKCYYTACFIPKRGLASCECERITEPVIIELDKLMNKERRYVKRNQFRHQIKNGINNLIKEMPEVSK